MVTVLVGYEDVTVKSVAMVTTPYALSAAIIPQICNDFESNGVLY